MRTHKFENKENKFDMDDIGYAFTHNSLGSRLDDIDVIVAEVCGENDGYPWYWILQMKNGTFSWATGGCDYTGWDCQSWAYIHDGYDTAEYAIEAVKADEFDSRPEKRIKEVLHAQVAEQLPFAVYTKE